MNSMVRQKSKLLASKIDQILKDIGKSEGCVENVETISAEYEGMRIYKNIFKEGDITSLVNWRVSPLDFPNTVFFSYTKLGSKTLDDRPKLIHYNPGDWIEIIESYTKK